MRSNHLLATAALASVVALIGCDKARPLPAPADPTRGCLSCHGGEENQTAAPPYSLPRNADGLIVASGNRFDHTANTTRIEVGAHTRHLARGVSCGACHVVPATINSPGHNTGKRATVNFKELAAAGNVIPSTWVPAVHTCTNYCHGASLNHGGTNQAPDWLGGSAAAACGTCHFTAGVTPPAPHPQGLGAGGAFPDTKTCAVCHTETVDAATGDINVTGGKHVNGQLDGGGGHPAGWADPANHGPAATGGLAGCAICHGADFAGNGTPAKNCNACHTTNGHPNWQTECTFCHGSATRSADATFPNVGTGTVVRANLASPPLGSQRENTITAYAVGAHEAHVGGGVFGRPAQCSECHGAALPADITHVNGTVAVGWGVTASNGIVPTPAAGNLARWNDATLPANGANCTNFCHGATLAGGSHTSPKWNEGAAGAACGSCHGIPLPYTAAGRWHVQRFDCNACHPGYAPGSVNLTDHIFVGAGPSGLTCTSCHGSSLANPAPPNDINGGTDANRVGAHQKHVATLTLHQGGFACTECHPDNGGNTRHANGSVNILWGPTATAGSYAAAPASGGVTPGSVFPNCTVYCHNPRPADTAATNKAPAWNPATTGTVTCGSCHGLPPAGTGHTNSTACSSCHDGYANAPTSASTFTAVSLANHINGVINVANLSCTSCHGTAGRSLAGADPLLAAAPPVAYTSTNAIGAHLAHVFQGDTAAPGPLSSPLACVNCHSGLIPAAAPHLYPANPVAFGNLAIVAGATPTAYDQATQTCSSTYCHGGFYGGNGANPITWGAAGKLTCTSCHGAPPAVATHPANPGTCGDCHPGYTNTTVNVALHANGQLDGGESSGATPCLNCHKTDAATGAAYGKMVSDTTVYHHVVAEGAAFKTYPTTSAGQACLQCHADHSVFNPSLNAANTLGRAANLRTTIATAPTAAAPGTGNYANTDFSGTAGVCVSCHATSLAKSTAQLSSAANFGASTMAVDGAAFGASAHAFTVAGTITTGGSTFNANCSKCHTDPPGAGGYPEKQSGTYKFALHTNPDKRLRNPMGITTGADDLEEKFCFRCHSKSTDALPAAYGPAKAVANRDYFNATAMSAASQNLYVTFTDPTHATAMHNVIAYTGKHQPIETGAYIAANRHVECEDCHNPHATKAGAKPASNSNLVWGPLTGVSGVNVATWPAAWTNTTAASYTVLASSTYEWQICFSCHSANNGSITTWTGLSTLAMTDLALEFNPANKSRHPVVGALNAAGSGTNALVASQLVTPWAPGNVMTCSDCHGADSVSPATQGPHGSAIRFLLKGANKAWPYTVAGATSGTLFKLSTSETGLGTNNGLFCRNCHPQMNSAGSNSIHRDADLVGGQHGGNANVPACTGCHIRVPHGGKVSRLFVTTNAPARYKVGTPNMAGFTKDGKDLYQMAGGTTSNFRSSCGQHNGGPAGEAW